MATSKRQRGHYDKRKFFIAFAIAVAILASIRHIFSISVDIGSSQQSDSLSADVAASGVTEIDWGSYSNSANDPTDNMISEEEASYSGLSASQLDEELSDSIELSKKDSIEDASGSFHEEDSMEGWENNLRPKSRIYGVVSYKEAFPDSNHVQLQAARKNGVRPAATRRQALGYVKQHRLVDITNSPYFHLNDLSHSMPYLVPKAQQLLNTIGMNFVDSLCAKRLPPHIIIVTSVLRTNEDVSRLKRGNRNATENSCHCYGTTVDISYNRFYPIVNIDQEPKRDLVRWDLDMKLVLSEVLEDLRQQGKCYVKYEFRQGCFHLTVR